MTRASAPHESQEAHGGSPPFAVAKRGQADPMRDRAGRVRRAATMERSMTKATRSHGGQVLTALVLGLALGVAGCGGGGGSSNPPTPPGPDTTAPTVSASPAPGWYSSTQNVTLHASDARDANPTIYYTTDLSVPDDTSAVYSAAISAPNNTVIKYFAVDASGNASAVQTAGYTVGGGLISQQWGESGHGMVGDEPWRHWDTSGQVDSTCSRCHSGSGFDHYNQTGLTDLPQPLPFGLACTGCHPGALGGPPATAYDDHAMYPNLDWITFPSGDTVSLFDNSNLCAQCHQGRASTVQVDDAIAGGPGPYSFINIHYFAAAATYFGGEVRGAYQYPGKTYVARNTFPSHTADKKTCVGCHMRGDERNHTLEPDLSACTTCHSGSTFETLGGSPSVNRTAIEANKTQLLQAMQAYAFTNTGLHIAYSADAYPYWFIDTNGNGVVDGAEGTNANKFTQFDATLLKAAYNYHVAIKEPCGFIHNGVYARQYLTDSIADLGETPMTPAPGRPGYTAPLSEAGKSQQWHLSGHGNNADAPYRHWDTGVPPEIPTSCAKCHSAPGFVDFAADGSVDAASKILGATDCITCHDSNNLFANHDTRYDDLAANPALQPVTFPSGLTASLGNASNICMTCHQGRESGVSVQSKIDTTLPPYSFLNIHYFAAAASFFGTNVNGGYQYSGKTYAGPTSWNGLHVSAGLNTCIGCHLRGSNADHNFLPQVSDCTLCHSGSTFETLEFGPKNNHDQIVILQGELLAQMQTYASANLGSGIVYSETAYPYWFIDTNGNGVLDAGEDTNANKFSNFDAQLLEAAYNYHFSIKEPCGFIHNGKYMRQLLYDAIVDLGGTPSVARP